MINVEAALIRCLFFEIAFASLLVEAAFVFPRRDLAFLIQLSALKVSIIYKQKLL